jgi:hypothetical protein
LQFEKKLKEKRTKSYKGEGVNFSNYDSLNYYLSN